MAHPSIMSLSTKGRARWNATTMDDLAPDTFDALTRRYGKPSISVFDSGTELASRAKPLAQRAAAVFIFARSATAMTHPIEMVVDRAMDGSEFLETSQPQGPEYRSLPSSQCQMAVLSTVVDAPAVRLMAASNAVLEQGGIAIA